MFIKRHAFLVGCLIIGMIFLAPVKFAMADISQKTPEWVKKDIENQITTIFGEEDRKGIPLADPNIDWDNFKNWPSVFFHNGTELVIRIEGVWDKEGQPLKSTKEILPGVEVDLWYFPKKQVTPHVRPSARWRRNGSLSHKSLVLWSPEQSRDGYSCSYFPSGELLYYSRWYVDRGVVQTDYFDKQANVIGSLLGSIQGIEPPIYKENGVAKDLKAYNQLIEKLNKENGLEMPYLGIAGQDIQK